MPLTISQQPEIAGTPAGGSTDAAGQILLKRRRARPFFARHPWVFAGSIADVRGEPPDGAEVVVLSHEGEFIARGLYNSKSQIRVRLYSWNDRALDATFWRERLMAAIELRRQLRLDDAGGACRLVFSEGDGLSGLIVDRYGPWLVVQFTSLAMARRLDTLLPLLLELCQPRGVYLRTERGIGDAEGLELTDGPLWGEPPDAPVAITENGIEFEVDFRTGQKTGFYLDQRDNRRAVASFARDRRVLDVFCYTGGFALGAARAGAAEVLSVDASRAAINLAQRNAAANHLGNVRFEAGDGFAAMERLLAEHSRFDVVVLDPPKFARRSSSVEDALRGYLRANLLAVGLLKRSGILATFSCSGHVLRPDFLAMLGSVSEQSSRPIQILAQLGQAPDHPISVACPETEYLKGVIARVG